MQEDSQTAPGSSKERVRNRAETPHIPVATIKAKTTGGNFNSSIFKPFTSVVIFLKAPFCVVNEPIAN
jgi:hypothetical protein